MTLLAVVATSGCAGTPDLGCVIPPPIIAESERDTAVEIAAKLESLPGGNLVVDFQDSMRVDFGRLSDPNACLYLYLKAIECYLREGEIGRDVALELASYVRVAWARNCGLRRAPLRLTREERALIENSEYAELLRRPMRSAGFE